MTTQKIAAISAAVYLGASPTAIFAVCDAAANFEIGRTQQVDEIVTYCLVEPVAGPKKGSIKASLYLQRVTGSLAAINLTNGGTGFTGTPTVAISGAGGGAAVAVVNLNTGKVVSVFVTAAGNYATTPTITFSGGGGTGAAATAVINSYNMDWLDPLFNGTMSVGGVIYYEIRPDGTGTGLPVYAGYFIPANYNAKFPSDGGAAMIEFDGPTNGWTLQAKQS